MTTNAESLVEEFQNMTPEGQRLFASGIRNANPDLFPQNDHARMILWTVLIVGVLIVALAAVAAGIALSAMGHSDTAAAAWALATAAIAGVLGLFAKSPLT